jgi:hypothetical protein
MGNDHCKEGGEKEKQGPIAEALASVEMTGLHGWRGGDGRLRTLNLPGP